MLKVRSFFKQEYFTLNKMLTEAIKEKNRLAIEAELQWFDFELFEHLQKNHIDPRFYAFRWLTLLLTQEFPFATSLRLWDALFCDGHRFAFLRHFSVFGAEQGRAEKGPGGLLGIGTASAPSRLMVVRMSSIGSSKRSKPSVMPPVTPT